MLRPSLHPGALAGRGLTWQKLILGDWSRFVRDPLDVCRILFMAATIVWASSAMPSPAWCGLASCSGSPGR